MTTPWRWRRETVDEDATRTKEGGLAEKESVRGREGGLAEEEACCGSEGVGLKKGRVTHRGRKQRATITLVKFGG
jgi:hypothetical protein